MKLMLIATFLPDGQNSLASENSFCHRLSMSQLVLQNVIVGLIVFVAAARAEPTVLPAIAESRLVDTNTMAKIFDEVKTPFKYGVVIKGAGTNELVDCPTVFRSGGHWYMMYVAISNKVGYQTFLARSDDLLNWTKLGKILSFTPTNHWDAWQADGAIALCDYRWDGTHEPEKFGGKYWLSYIGGGKQGYETDPLSVGIAWTKKLTGVKEWNRISENPVLSGKDADAREFEKRTLYKTQIIHDEKKSLGWPFIAFYNGKKKNGFERIGMAVSRDMIHWNRYGENPVVANGEARTNGMSGDPQLVKIGDVWTMFYFGAGWKPKAFDTFACSYDLVHWTKWDGANLVEPSEDFDKTYAHKPWVVKWNGVVYHFYCAVGREGRVIAVATSKDLKNSTATK
jgi:predicted GH43/DUF377 family glycosyl hydrolase